jgi:hypothetical protein
VGAVTQSGDGSLQFRAGACPADHVACGSFSDASLHASGFGQLRIRTSSRASDALQMRAAGFLEGVLTHRAVKAHHINLRAWVVEQAKGELALVEKWLAEQDAWAAAQASSRAAEEPLWEQTALVLAQVCG